ncbi:hypothetical protein P170DRAFT_445772 [Aspergillus steynii IBT 23096]|uniref:Transcription factor TFIIIC triple barrel domain-containing protein n=1 Tax=Aspergillus steynii IBT 23096 TaxID=1392250 RepID=A0A2I2GC93_9EURO|nr:uncharacterized protein P170DRAFT_445772 [Aspergillus steynii IBT 23096]PLB50475.1 hypothetical protein P170DRAFT_445772 [Aspergillus steynii IBT 23096]
MHPVDPVLVLDPAILPDPAAAAEDDSDYEYEYHDHATETFYLTLDLASNQNLGRPSKRRQDSQSVTTPRSLPTESSHRDGNEPALASTEVDSTPEERVQILGLHTPNPIVSYRNQIFNCSWADQIGTELLFAQPEVESDPDSAAPTKPLRRGKDFDLIAANSVKIFGRKANLISSAGPAPPMEPLEADVAQDTDPATTRRTGPMSNQARFLERLKSIKQAKGETDTIRSSFSLRRAQNLEERLRGWAQTGEQLTEIQRLNDAAVQGNTTAMADLENLYIQLGSQDHGLPAEAFQPR